MASLPSLVASNVGRATAAAAVAAVTELALEARREASSEPDDVLRKEKEVLVDNVVSGAKSFEKACNIGFISHDLLANENLDASVAAGLNEIKDNITVVAKEAIETVKRNIDRCNEIEPGSIQYEAARVRALKSIDDGDDIEERNGMIEDDDSKMEVMEQNGLNGNNQQMIIGEKDYLSDDSKCDEIEQIDAIDGMDDSEHGYSVRRRLRREQKAKQGKQEKVRMQRKVERVENEVEGQVRSESQKNCKILVLLSAFFYAGIVVLRQLNKVM